MKILIPNGWRVFLLAALMLLAAQGTGQAVTYNLKADAVTVTMPDGAGVLMWGFGLEDGPVTVPGPTLDVPAGEDLTINLTNNLPVPVSIVSPGLGLGAPPTPVKTGGRVESFTTAASAGGGTASYTFTGRPGTFLYESGTNPAVQVQMGLYGAVRIASGTAGQAYDSASSAYDVDQVLVLSEIDPALHAAVQAGTYGTALYPSTIEYSPQYFLINGTVYSALANPTVYLGVGAAGQNVLLRLVNAGLNTHIMTLQGAYMTCVAEGGYLLPFAKEAFALPMEAGKTKDAVVTFAADGTYPFYDRRLYLTNAGTYPGGMMVMLNVGSVPVDASGPVTSNVVATPNPADAAVTLTANADDAATGNSDIAQAEWWEGTTDPGQGSGTPMDAADGAFDSPAEALTAGLDVSAWTGGPHTVSVRSRDAAGNWGAPTSITLTVPYKTYISLGAAATVGGTPYQPSDILEHTGAGTYSLLFDASDAGVPAAANLRAFDIISATEILMAFKGSVSLPGLGTVAPTSIVKFTATSLGDTTAGSFSLYFKGSLVGLNATYGRVDAVEMLPGGDLLISTSGRTTVQGMPVMKSDIIRFTPTALGDATAGAFSMYFNGPDVGLSTTYENIDGVAVDNGKIYLSTTGAFAVTGVSGKGNDIFVFTPTTLGTTTAGSFSATLFFQGSASGLGAVAVDAVEIQ